MADHELGSSEVEGSVRMTNDDFRRLMMTPRVSTSSMTNKEPKVEEVVTPKKESKGSESRRKKKAYYAKLKRDEDDVMAKLAAKYRDRAKERREHNDDRDNDNDDDNEYNDDKSREGGRGYPAVANDNKTLDDGERRKRVIEESKYLGGDMEHTHLVKGLDFALLQKVRSEIAHREKYGDDNDEENVGDDDDDNAANDDDEVEENEKRMKKIMKFRTGSAVTSVKSKVDKPAVKGSKSNQVEPSLNSSKDPLYELLEECRSGMAKSVVRSVFKSDVPRTNELFYPGRMAYVMELQNGESDIPTTTVRSKADIENADIGQKRATISTNDIVINKLTQILAYLRTGNRGKSKKKRDRISLVQRQTAEIANNIKREPKEDQDIYDDVGDYKAGSSDKGIKDGFKRGRDGSDKTKKSRSRDLVKGEKGSYFGSESVPDEKDKEHKGGLSSNDKDFIRKLATKERERERRQAPQVDAQGGVALAAVDGYAECYPGLQEMNDAIEDSDDETDFSKMDGSNKKGPVNRWDFDSTEEYSAYMSSKEAMPKAAFQYGVKMSSGRKTRGKVGQRGAEKAKLDKEWTKISAILEKRKGDSKDNSEAKRKKSD